MPGPLWASSPSSVVAHDCRLYTQTQTALNERTTRPRDTAAAIFVRVPRVFGPIVLLGKWGNGETENIRVYVFSAL